MKTFSDIFPSKCFPKKRGKIFCYKKNAIKMFRGYVDISKVFNENF